METERSLLCSQQPASGPKAWKISIYPTSHPVSLAYFSIPTSSIFWDITLCSALSVNRHFGGACHLHLQGRRRNHAVRTSNPTFQYYFPFALRSSKLSLPSRFPTELLHTSQAISIPFAYFFRLNNNNSIQFLYLRACQQQIAYDRQAQ
jgi:hypothetical protein